MKSDSTAFLGADVLAALPELSDWQPKPLELTFSIDNRNAARMAALFDLQPIVAGSALPPLWHWAFSQEPSTQREIGEDGHPKKGGFLPPISLPRRMFAGSRLSFNRPLIVGETYRGRASIDNISMKRGKSGKLAFVKVEHRITRDDGSTCLSEYQDIVYREASTSAQQPKPAASGDNNDWDWEEKMVADPVFLFRYSAVTYNSHRIHYDLPYATEVEGYPGLVVHGPLLATLMTKSVGNRIRNAQLASFEFAGKTPVFGGSEFKVVGRRLPNSNRVETAILINGSMAMSGRAELL